LLRPPKSPPTHHFGSRDSNHRVQLARFYVLASLIGGFQCQLITKRISTLGLPFTSPLSGSGSIAPAKIWQSMTSTRNAMCKSMQDGSRRETAPFVGGPFGHFGSPPLSYPQGQAAPRERNDTDLGSCRLSRGAYKVPGWHVEIDMGSSIRFVDCHLYPHLAPFCSSDQSTGLKDLTKFVVLIPPRLVKVRGASERRSEPSTSRLDDHLSRGRLRCWKTLVRERRMRGALTRRQDSLLPPRS